MQQITKIVITGGPCGGKSTALSKLEKHFTGLGYRVVFVSEAATELILNGVVPWVGKNADFQNILLRTQRNKEQLYRDWVEKLSENKALLICDRGALDNKAYMTDDEFEQVASGLQTNEIELRDNYDAIFHLVTAANGAEQFYTTANNEARTETPEEATILDNKLIAAWTGHPHLRVIDNSTDFEAKMQRLVSEVAGFVGEPVPFEIERKFIIKYPDLDLLERLENCSKVEIIQTYLHSEKPGEETRVRQRGRGGQYIFTETIKKRVSELKRVETERRLSQAEYLSLLMNADTALRQIRKTRYCLSFSNQYMEIDIYPFWNRQAVLEVELSDENQEIVFPEFLKVLRDVSGEGMYENRSLAENVPDEIC